MPRQLFWLAASLAVCVGAVAAEKDANKAIVDQLCGQDFPELQRTLARDPQDSAEAAARSGDFRYLMWAGIAGAFPGVEDQKCAAQKDHYKWMRGTSDAVCSEQHGFLMTPAHAWAERYNRRMSELRKAHGLESCSRMR